MLNQQLIRNKFNANAKKADRLAFLYTEIVTRMQDRLDLIKLQPKNILDIGSGLDLGSQMLSAMYPDSDVYRLDFAHDVLKLAKNGLTNQVDFNQQQNENIKTSKNLFICGDAIHLPLTTKSVDLVWSNLMLPYVDDLNTYFKEVRRILNLNGCCLISGLGVDSLKQIRQFGFNTYNFPDMHMIGDLLLKLGFTDPVTDMEKLTLEYEDFDTLMKDVRILGIGNAITDQQYKFKRKEYIDFKQQFIKHTQNGAFPLTLEVFYINAWKTKDVVDLPEGQQAISFM